MSSDPLAPRPVDRALDPGFRHGQSMEPNYSGVTSFLRRRYARDGGGAEVVVWGVPLDVTVSNRPGTRFGPRALRAASSILDGDPLFPFRADPFAALDMADAGDCVFDYGLPASIPAAIEAQAARLYATGAHLVTLGGDHFLTYPILKALVAKTGAPVALVQFDAHQDTWDDDGTRVDHGTMITRAVKDGLIRVDRSIQVGIRTHAPQDYGIAIIDGFQAGDLGPKGIAAAIAARVGDAPVYLSFDIDAIDPAFAPGTGTPVCGGLSSREALDTLRRLGGLDLKGFDVVEVSPPYDHADVTALAGASLAACYLGVLAGRKASGASIVP
ncbi:agmatinase [Azorhizobium caulinodans ORS 571]|jgi:agmatinase|uniref:Agmatinase n=1 Tax=Azorhizobium caulinodans (strain ATCC 43989 / DSM 5975 / JCM 20966 / LMG 6465 / NBRC 14845 / NCIMB 13405 / ORS 571) TaxID=438753 RepID=A8HRL1_AZOC5|nr:MULTISPECIES: agmatinase [Azorhizobium]TDT92582.1 agmatinase [Azorhizobium sp. AG788]BAF87204.1 agmatinase [Azorhizobium caulinodans ORS 571]